MPRWNLESLTNRQGITYAESNLITWFYSQFDNNAAGSGLNRHIANVEPLYYQGTIAATEFLVYAATKLYLCLEAGFGYASNPSIGSMGVNFYNPADIFTFSISNCAMAYNAGNDFYNANTVIYKNFYFSRFVTLYEFMTFNGFRITLD